MFNLTYKGKSFNQREEDSYVNVGQLCATHGKSFKDWKRNQSADDYIQALAETLTQSVGQICLPENLVANDTNFIGGFSGTWAHPLVAIEVARWIDPAFGVWCNIHIKTLIESGTTSITLKQNDEQSWLDYGYSLTEKAMLAAGLPKALAAQTGLAGVIKAAPRLAVQLEPTLQALINSTASSDELLNVTQLGKELGLSARAVNKLLIEKGFQVPNSKKTSARDLAYRPTELGERYSQVVQSADGSGRTFQQLRWNTQLMNSI
jgi:hypothetical protein